MGQQQLLLLVLGIVIVGIAVVAGIQAFSEGKAKAEQDAAVSDAMRIISDVQAWKLKPGAFGGGGTLGDGDFTGVSFAALGYDATDEGFYSTINGCYTLDGGGSGATIELFGGTGTTTEPGPDNELGTSDDVEVASCDSNDLIATVTVAGTGTDSGSISWDYEGGAEGGA